MNGDNQNGPNDGPLVCDSFFPSRFLDTNIILRLYMSFEGAKRVPVGRDNGNGPKRRQTRRLGQ